MRYNRIMIYRSILILVSAFFIASCGDSNQKTSTDTPTSGNIDIMADATVFPVIRSVAAAFEIQCPKAKINVLTGQESEAYEQLVTGKVPVIFVSRLPNENENAVFEKRKMKLRPTAFASDGVAFITHSNRPDTIHYNILLKFLTGEYSFWSQWVTGGKKEKVMLVFDNANSSTVSLIRQHTKNKLSPEVKALDSNQAVIDYIRKNPNAIGIIGLNWISDGRDQTTGSFYEGFHVMGIEPADTSRHAGNFYKPYQAYLLSNAYPFTRTIYAVNGEPKYGLGTGFVSYLSGYKGQVVVQQGGLLPRTQTTWIKEIEIKK